MWKTWHSDDLDTASWSLEPIYSVIIYFILRIHSFNVNLYFLQKQSALLNILLKLCAHQIRNGQLDNFRWVVLHSLIFSTFPRLVVLVLEFLKINEMKERGREWSTIKKNTIISNFAVPCYWYGSLKNL